MIGSLISLISINVTSFLLTQGICTPLTLPITNATATTPITVTSTGHGFPLQSKITGYVSGVTGETEANGWWLLTPLDANTFSLASVSAQVIIAPSVGTNAYISGGSISYAFPEGQILLGRRHVQSAGAVVSPRIVMVPTRAMAVGFSPYVGQGQAWNARGTAEQATMKLVAQAATDYTTFDVYFTAGANPPDPDFGDFDAVQLLAWSFYNTCWDLVGDAVDVKMIDWPSQTEQAGSQSQRGQRIHWVVQFNQPITIEPKTFVPVGTFIEFTVEPINAGSTDPVIFTVS